MSLIATLVQTKCVSISKSKWSSIAKLRLYKCVINFTLKSYAKYVMNHGVVLWKNLNVCERKPVR